MSYLQLGDFDVQEDDLVHEPHGYVLGGPNGYLKVDSGVGGIFDKIKKGLKKTAAKVLKPVRTLIGAASKEDLDKTKGVIWEKAKNPETTSYKWAGGKEGDIDSHGIPYGTPMAEAQVMLARAAVANPEVEASMVVAAPTAAVLEAAGVAPVEVPPETAFESLMPGGSSNILGIPTLYVLGGAAVAVLGIGYYMKTRRRK